MDVLMEAGAAHYVPIHSAGRQRTDTLKEKINLTMSKLISWSKQVANGMDYLSSRNVIHGDLASRWTFYFLWENFKSQIPNSEFFKQIFVLNSFSTGKLKKRNFLGPITFFFQLLKLRKNHGKNWWNKLVSHSKVLNSRNWNNQG